MTRQPIDVGDEVEWKRRGARGSYRARVVAVTPKRIQIKLIQYSDMPAADLSGSTPRWVKPVFLRVRGQSND